MVTGRPSDYTLDKANEICALLAGGQSLKRICDQEGMPDRVTVYSWMDKHPDFLNKYVRAKDDSSDALADDIQNISDDVLAGRYEPNAARVAIDAKKWIASKLKPKKYGDKLDMTTNGKDVVIPILGGAAKNVSTNDSDKETSNA